jgi:hypothetical protein
MADDRAVQVIADAMAAAMQADADYRARLSQTPGIGQPVSSDLPPQGRMAGPRKGLGYSAGVTPSAPATASYVAHSGAAGGRLVHAPVPVSPVGAGSVYDMLLAHQQAGWAFPDNPDADHVTIVSVGQSTGFRKLLDKILRRK